MNAIVFMFACSGFVQEAESLMSDAIRDQLNKARVTQAEQVTRAAEVLHEELNVLLKTAAEKADLRLARLLQKQIDDFQNVGLLPTSPVAARAVAEYRCSVDSAREALLKALQQARDECTKQLHLDAAELIASEIETLEAERPQRKPKSERQPSDADEEDGAGVDDELKAGSTWRGQLTQQWFEQAGKGPSGPPKRYSVEMQVLERKGSQFKARINLDGGDNIREVKGTISRSGAIRMPASKMDIRQGIGKVFDHQGRLRENVLRLEFSGINWEGQFTRGFYTLEQFY